MMANDETPSVCASVLKIEKNPQYGKAELLGDRILYTPNGGYTGSDVLTYSLADSIAADVRIRVIDAPDHILDATCVINAPVAPWKVRELPVNLRDTIDNCAPLTVGDIDGDGRVEVLAYRPGLPTDEKRTGMKMLCYRDGRMELKRAFDFKDGGGVPFSSSAAGAPAIARYNGGGHIVVMNDNDFLLYAFDENGNFRWKSYLAATDSIPATNIGIADFNGDGIPEVYTGAHIFSLANGNILCNGDISGAHNKGLLPAGGGYASVAVDMDGDGLPELCAGSQVYNVSIPDGATYARAGTMSVFMELDAIKLPANAAKDGATLAADIDNDGLPEVIVVSLQSGNLVVYVWKPLPNGRSYLIGSYALPGNSTRYGIPAIGNIDADPYPEIVFLSDMNPDEIFALEYKPGNAPGSQIDLKWRMADSDMSGNTGISLFDFNQDGIAEIVYRNETRLRIFDGGGSSPVALSTTDNVTSTTLHEMPVIADIDGDGRAEIIVSGGRGAAAGAGAAEEKRNGYLRVFKSDGLQWAPARKVWNQYAYHAVHINNDLTVPEYQLNPSVIFPGAGGAYGDSDDVRTCNAFMQQQTVRNRDGKPLFPAPHGEVVSPLTTFYNAPNDSLALHFRLTNSGEAGFQPPLYVTAYKDGAVVGAAIVTDSIM